jgi:hypothetical protein
VYLLIHMHDIMLNGQPRDMQLDYTEVSELKHNLWQSLNPKKAT